jgi:hypothetical protein
MDFESSNNKLGILVKATKQLGLYYKFKVTIENAIIDELLLNSPNISVTILLGKKRKDLYR